MHWLNYDLTFISSLTPEICCSEDKDQMPQKAELHQGLRHLLTQNKFEPSHEISTNVVCATSQVSDKPVQTRRRIRAFASRLNIICVLSY